MFVTGRDDHGAGDECYGLSQGKQDGTEDAFLISTVQNRLGNKHSNYNLLLENKPTGKMGNLCLVNRSPLIFMPGCKQHP